MKMGEAGKLYLKDYYILSEANGEMAEYLDDVLTKLENLFNEKAAELRSDNYLWECWKNKSSDGTIQFNMKPVGEQLPSYLRKGKEDIWLRVMDVRATTELKTTSMIYIELFTNKSSKELISRVSEMNPEFQKSDIFGIESVNLILENSEETANKIMKIAHALMLSVNTTLDDLIKEYRKGKPIS